LFRLAEILRVLAVTRRRQQCGLQKFHQKEQESSHICVRSHTDLATAPD
jgi:hypothetical protein